MKHPLKAFGLLLLFASVQAAGDEPSDCHRSEPLAALSESAEARLAIVRSTGRAPPCTPVPAVYYREVRDEDGHHAPYQVDVTPELSVSSKLDEQWVRSLADPAIRGTPFTHVITFVDTDKRHRPIVEEEREWVEAAGMIAVSLPAEDGEAPRPEYQRDWVVELLTVLTTPGVRVLMHCNAGKGRTHMAKAIWRIAVHGWSIADARKEAEMNGTHGEKPGEQQDFIEQMGRKIQDPANPLGLSEELLSRLCISYSDQRSGS